MHLDSERPVKVSPGGDANGIFPQRDDQTVLVQQI